jgi:hypothetical protein
MSSGLSRLPKNMLACSLKYLRDSRVPEEPVFNDKQMALAGKT